MFWSTMRTTGRKASRRRLSFEQCESRRLMAVTTSLSDGTLTITGDADADVITINGTANPGEVQVTGYSGTVVDGVVDGATTIQGVTADLLADLGDGNNQINLDNLFLAGKLEVVTGDGDDAVIFGARSIGAVSSAGDCFVNTNGGDDEFRMEEYRVFIGGQLDVLLGGGGHDAARMVGASAVTGITISGGGLTPSRTDILMQGITSGGRLDVNVQSPISNVAIFTSAASQELVVNAASGQNSIYIDTCYSARSIVVNSFSSNTPFFPSFPPPPIAAPYNIDDTVTVARCQTPHLFVNTTGDANPTYFGGNDTVVIYGNNLVGPLVANPGAHVLSVKTGDGNDQVSASYNVVIGVAFVGLDELDDTLTLVGNLVTGFASADGGTGSNRLNLLGNQFGGSAFTNFQ